MSERIYAWLLKLYPAAFREEYGSAARQLFLDRLLAERGFFARCRLWFDVIIDLAVSIPREHRRCESRPESQPGEYRLSEADVAAMMSGWRMSRTTLLFYFYSAVAAGLMIGWLANAPRAPLLIMYGLLAPFGIVLHYWRTNRFKRFWLGYELIIETDRIQERNSSEALDVTVFRTDVTSIIESHAGFGVLTNSARPAIWVPSQLRGYEQVRGQLAAWMPINRPQYLHDRIFLPGRAVKCLLIATYVPAVVVQSLHWFLPLALVSAGVLFSATLRQRRERKWVKGVIIPLLGLVPLIVNAMALFRAR